MRISEIPFGLSNLLADWLERLVPEMTYYVSSGTLNSTTNSFVKKHYQSNAVALIQRMSTSPNQCCYFTLQNEMHGVCT